MSTNLWKRKFELDTSTSSEDQVKQKVGLSRSKNILFYLLHWKPFKNDEKYFLFHLKSSFGSQDI